MRTMDETTELLFDRDIYSVALLPSLRLARRHIKVATANIKDLWVEGNAGFEPLTELLAAKARDGVSIRILHSGQASERFERRLEEAGPGSGLDVRACRRNHMKLLLVDGFQAYVGSANLTGAGVGAKSEQRRNFEVGFLTRDLSLVRELERRFDAVWSGAECPGCAWAGECRIRAVDGLTGVARRERTALS